MELRSVEMMLRIVETWLRIVETGPTYCCVLLRSREGNVAGTDGKPRMNTDFTEGNEGNEVTR